MKKIILSLLLLLLFFTPILVINAADDQNCIQQDQSGVKKGEQISNCCPNLVEQDYAATNSIPPAILYKCVLPSEVKKTNLPLTVQPAPTIVSQGISVTVNPTEKEPIKVENSQALPTSTVSSTSSGGVVPGVTTKVNINNIEQKIEINLDKTNKETQISIGGGVSVSTAKVIEINDSKLYMQTTIGPQEIKILPKEASANATEITTVREIKLEEKSQTPVYSISGTTPVSILFLLPISMSVKIQVDAQTGQVVSTQKPWWSFLAW